MGGEAGHIEEAHRQEDEADRDRKDARREAEAAQGSVSPGALACLRKRVGERGRLGAALAFEP